MSSTFDIVVVTAPTKAQCEIYFTLCNHIKSSNIQFHHTSFFCVNDPLNCRVGSGGGTINAIDYLNRKLPLGTLNLQRILIIHSGGDSRRSPLHSICGKAWATLNCSVDKSFAASPLRLLLVEFDLFFSKLSRGAVVVASSDVLLDIHKNGQELLFPQDAVTIVAVPELARIACNHGVIISTQAGKNMGDLSVESIKKYLQKPSLEEMYSSEAIIPLLLMNNSNSDKKNADSVDNQYALIDTGVVVFTGTAMQQLVRMTTDPVLTQCTCYGLEASNKKSVRLELYSELLLALTLSDGTCSLTEYYARLKYVSPTIQLDSSDGLYQYEAALRAVYDYLHMIPFYVAVVKKGVFGHLGTSSEFVELLNIASARKTEGTTASTLSSSHIRTNTRDKNMKFAIKYDLRQVLGGAIVVPYQPSRPPIRVLDHVKGTSVNSLVHLYSIDNATSTTILSGTVGVDSVIEHSMLSGQFSIGRNCYISHIQSELGHNLQIHDNMMFQQAPLQSSSTLSSSSLSESVLILLGMNDDMKAQYDSAKATIWGGAWSHLLQSISIGLQDRGSGDVVDFLWDNSEADKSLWTAKIFTLWSPDQFILSFMQAVHTYDWTDEKFIQVIPEYILLGLSEFVNAPVRYSLADLLKKADAGAMHRWRCFVYVSVDTFYPAASRDSLRAVVCRTNHVDISKEEEVERDKRSLINSSFQINEPVTKVELGIISDSHMTTIMHQIYESCHTQLTKLSSTLKAHYLSKLVKSQISTTACSSKEEGTSSIDTVDTLEISAALVLLGQMLHTISAPTNQAQTVAIFAQMLSTLSMSTPFNLLNMKILSEDASFLRVAYSDTNFGCTDSYLSAPLEVTSKFSQLISNYFRSFLSPITTILLARTLLGESVFKSLPSEFLPRYLFVCSWLCNGQKIATVTYEEASSVFSISQDSTLQDKVTELHNEVNVRVQRVFQRLLELASMSHNRLLTKNSNFDNKSDISSTNITLSDLLERSAHALTSVHIQYSSLHKLQNEKIEVPPLSHGRVVVSCAPARIDLMGGWSDTPPICYESSGSVLNVAVSVDGVKPISCASRLIHEPVIRLRSLRIKSNSSNSSGSEDSSGDVNALNDVVSKRVAYEGDCVDCTSVDSFADVSNPHAAAALLKAVMIVLGVISLPSSDFNENSKKLKRSELSDQFLSRFGGGIEIACVSALPAGSGMGGSSILAAAVLKSLATLLGLPCSNDTLIYQVLRVEQILTTNGGWQDQVGAIYGGFKIARSPASLPLHVTVDPVPMSDLFLKQFQSRCVLIFTGTQRLAKDTLINALHKHALTPSKIQTSNIIYLLRRHAESAASALMQRQLSKDTNMDDVVDELGGVLSHYWMLKRAMAEGCEPPYISRLMHHLRNLCVGISLCGAGAGGFLVAILNTNVSRQMLQDTLDIYANEEISLYQSQPLNLSTHHVIVDNEGITTQIYENSQSNDLTDYLFA